MAYFTQEMKKQVAAELKKVIPTGWKYSLGVDDYSTLVLNILAAPVDLMKLAAQAGYSSTCGVQVNPHYMDRHFAGTEVAELFAKVQKVLFCCGYYDDSDLMRDYHDTAYYVNVNIGKWNKDFVNTAA